MSFREFLKTNNVYLDGGMGTLLQQKGLQPGEHPERWNISHPEIVTEIHKAYFDAGSNVVCSNTFGANILKFSKEELDEIIKCAFENARKAAGDTSNRFVALDIGPTGKLLKPFGDLEFEDAVSVFAETVRLGVKYGADLVFIETFGDSYETKAAVLAAKENSHLPILVSNAYGSDGKLMTGASPQAMVALLEGLGVDALGANCSLGPKQLEGVVSKLLEKASVPVIFKPNAGLPKTEKGKTFFDITPDEFALQVANMMQKGVRVAGGCCGTTPEYIKKLTDASRDFSPAPVTDKGLTAVSSYSKAVCFGGKPLLIGERINPTGKKRFKQALVENDLEYILNEGLGQQEHGADILDVNVGIPDINEAEMLCRTVTELQSVTDLPLQIDTSNISAMEKAMRLYNGKPLVNSVNGKADSMAGIFPLVKKYGGTVIALTLDENGIPETAEGRCKIAERILSVAKEYGIDKKDIVFDTLAMTVSADTSSALTTLNSLKWVRNNLGCHTSLGVSNISFGLPERDTVTATFFALALENGLSAAIMNPYSEKMTDVYKAFNLLKGMDENCSEYIAYASEKQPQTSFAPSEPKSADLSFSILKGMKDSAAAATKELLLKEKPLEIVNNRIIPALDEVGAGYEKGTLYLPQLLMSAEAAKSAFEVVKTTMSASASTKYTVVIATVKGDIHDIGKNIVKLLLQNYGYNVVDLGKDVPPERILKAVLEHNAPLAGLSALMTTTVPAMEETVKLIQREAPFCKTVVGGAVLNEEYASKIGADFYARDAMETVRYAEKLLKDN